MKTILFFSVIFCVCASPALGELTPSDLDKIRLIVKEEVKTEITALRKEIKADIAALREELKADITALREEMAQEHTKLEKQLKTYTDIKIDGLDQRILLLVGFVSGLMLLVVITVGVPQVIMAWRDRKEQTLEKKIEAMAEEIERLKQQHTVNP